MSACKTRKENFDNQRIVDEFLFGNSIQPGYLLDLLPSVDKNFTNGVSVSTNGELILKINNILYKFLPVKTLGEGSNGKVMLYYDNYNQVSLAIKHAKTEE